MTLLAGFDAGQTHTRCRLSLVKDGLLQPVGEGEGPGVSHLDAPLGEQRFLEAIRTSAQHALKDHPTGFIQAAVVGASGIEHGTRLQQRAEALVSQALAIGDGSRLGKVLVTGDERTALRGAIPEGAGILAISGTGMIVLGRGEDGHEHRCGGWGWLLDGAGSAFDLGHQGLQLTLRMADGRLPDHPLRLQIWNQMGCDNHAAVKARVVQHDFSTENFAALAPLVVEAAAQGCSGAEEIVQRSAVALTSCISTVAQQLFLRSPLVVCHGGAVTHLHGFRTAVQQAILQSIPEAQWGEARGDACDGALLMAQELTTIRP
ncbi:BadF/BadG/BcrA/BcrD ATPase family protein [Synechococcus sp. MU1650]|uniref:BadF/BadG/BcrA/BcrD ATPase family protein n=1 Tax=Synechococcus sp. MU1650 TaxID=2508352 RepID=UPI001CF91735|nr:BadF/BadG/BcrA/BcrD ATPase family protein [Synechococcus sp. MU1650]MCB4377985.1 N-acetylglucosamine kinase [Synechococcus sp. MU1650]